MKCCSGNTFSTVGLCKYIHFCKKHSRRLCVTTLMILFTSMLMYAIHWERFAAEHYVAYLNDPCELTESQMDQYRTAIVAYTRLLEEFNQTYWLDFGTLMGAYRCKDLLPHDGDADISRISVGSRSRDKALTRQMGDRLKKIGAVLSIYTLKYKNISVDIFIWKRDGEMLRNSYGVHGNIAPFPQDAVFPLKKANFSGHEVNVPNNVTYLLKLRYPFSGTQKITMYKWRCYFRILSTFGASPPKCPKPIRNESVITSALSACNISHVS